MKLAPVATGRSAFTLIELVVSSALMVGVLGAAYLCLRAGVLGRDLVDSRSDVAQTARVALALIAADLRSATPLSREFEFLGMNRVMGTVEADNLDFATHNHSPAKLNEADFCEVSYFLDHDLAAGDYVLWRRRDATPDPEPLEGGTREQIANGIRGLKFEYYDGFDWYDEWGDAEGRRQALSEWMIPSNLYGMPEAVRVTMRFAPVARSSESTADGEEEPPLVFETVVRLNLAGRVTEETGSSSGADSSSGRQAEPAPSAPGGNN